MARMAHQEKKSPDEVNLNCCSLHNTFAKCDCYSNLQVSRSPNSSSDSGIPATPRSIRKCGSCRAARWSWCLIWTRTTWVSPTQSSLKAPKVFQAQSFQGHSRNRCSFTRGSTSWACISSLAVHFAFWVFLQVNSRILMWMWKYFGKDLLRICATNSMRQRTQPRAYASWNRRSSLVCGTRRKNIEQFELLWTFLDEMRAKRGLETLPSSWV